MLPVSDDILNMTIKAVHICCFADRSGTNEWGVFLSDLEEDTLPVEVDCAIENHSNSPRPLLPGGLKAALLFYPNYFTNAEKRWDIKVIPGQTVQDVYDLVIQGRLDKFEFTSNRAGHRWWIQTFIKLLSDTHFFVDKSQVREALQGLRRSWPGGSDRRITQGLFY
ncbi:uncharacterized protein N7511_005670 [Penicillium nucicola]|uniref:uncharacterized protein n=1 Tax=Penicillium nucicola TaxID=1850975 RepID=UPI00254570DA|nr:uncharacterized protein N7511_005670 [Penicillium nucicola]KAJ5762288.1 hypothetical protein N7511_005670 [Penicillium nucicola]